MRLGNVITIKRHNGFQSTHRVSDATVVGHVEPDPDDPFQSTHRVSDATTYYTMIDSNGQISIHAPRERCDLIGILL